MREKYIQIGVTALRDPATGGYLPAVPLYIKAENATEEAEQKLLEGLGSVFAKRIGAYIDSCKKEGVDI